MSLTEAAIYPAEIREATRDSFTVYRVDSWWNIETEGPFSFFLLEGYEATTMFRNGSVNIERDDS